MARRHEVYQCEVCGNYPMIELIADGEIYRHFLNPGDAPEAVFAVTADQVSAREYCNLYGLWKA